MEEKMSSKVENQDEKKEWRKYSCTKQSCLKLSRAEGKGRDDGGLKLPKTEQSRGERERRWWAASQYHIHGRTSHCYTPCGVRQASPDTEPGREFFPWDLKSVCSEYLLCKVGRTQLPLQLLPPNADPGILAVSKHQRPMWGVAVSTSVGRLDRSNSLRPGGLPRDYAAGWHHFRPLQKCIYSHTLGFRRSHMVT